MGIEQDYRDKIFRDLINAGINPFFELDIDNMPAEGAPWATYFPTRKIYGNAIDGVPGMERKSTDDTIHYLHKGPVDVESWQDQADLNLEEINKTVKHLRMGFNALSYAPSTTTITVVTSYGVTQTTGTLAGGVLANHILLSPPSGKKVFAKQLRISTDNVTDAEKNLLNIIFHEETSGTILARLSIGQAQMGQAIPLDFVTATATKDILCDITRYAGADAQNVYFHLYSGIF